MKRRSIKDTPASAPVSRPDCPDWALRRLRLERLARLVEAEKEPVRLFSTMECYPRKKRLALRQNGSPLAIAFKDSIFRIEGLAGDSVADGVSFFKLSLAEAHTLLCDCHYGGVLHIGQSIGEQVAQRARSLAARHTFAELRDRLTSWLGRR
ncbi:hypothetical protein MJC1_03061 [Methylocystis sp. MJC1]|nr:hypothetical protein MJC1_03061 [Methylocystis sp. MJC1]